MQPALGKKAIGSGKAQLVASKQVLPVSIFNALGYKVAHSQLEKMICFLKYCSTFWLSSRCTNFHRTYNPHFLSVFINVFFSLRRDKLSKSYYLNYLYRQSRANLSLFQISPLLCPPFLFAIQGICLLCNTNAFSLLILVEIFECCCMTGHFKRKNIS